MHELYRMLGNEREADLRDDAAKIHGRAKASAPAAPRVGRRLPDAVVAFVGRLRRVSVNYEVKEESK